jgi:hypothetical protein
MKLWMVLTLALLVVGCSSATHALSPAPKPTLSAIDVYINETTDYYESLASATALVKSRLADEQKDAALFGKPEWRDALIGALQRIRRDYQTVSQAPPPIGTEEYHTAMIQAESHTDQAAALLLAWLDDKDGAKFEQAQQEMATAESGLAQAQKVLDALMKNK